MPLRLRVYNGQNLQCGLVEVVTLFCRCTNYNWTLSWCQRGIPTHPHNRQWVNKWLSQLATTEVVSKAADFIHPKNKLVLNYLQIARMRVNVYTYKVRGFQSKQNISYNNCCIRNEIDSCKSIWINSVIIRDLSAAATKMCNFLTTYQNSTSAASSLSPNVLRIL